MNNDFGGSSVRRSSHSDPAGAPPGTAVDAVVAWVRRAPYLVIALMAHLTVGAVLSLMYFTQAAKPVVDGSIVAGMHEVTAPTLKKPEEESPTDKIDRTTVPAATVAAPEDFTTGSDDVLNPDSTTSDPFGMEEGKNSNATDTSMSEGGHHLSGAIGLGGGSHAGGGAKHGRPTGGPRSIRRTNTPAEGKPFQTGVDNALEWLKRHQNPDGGWSADSFAGNCNPALGAACTGRGSATWDAGVTGLALLAFLGIGHDQMDSPYREVVRTGLRWLTNNQDVDGCFGQRSEQRFTYNHAVATLAMCEAFEATRNAKYKTSAQNGVNFIAQCQNPYSAWRYGMHPGDNDVSVTGWMMMALKSAKDAKLTVNDSMLKNGMAYIESMTDEEGRTGYIKKGEHPVRPDGQQNRWPAAESESLTAVAMCCRIFSHSADGNPAMKGAAELLSKKLPVWDEAGGKIDMYYWYYGTLAMFQVGGPEWQRWNKSLKGALDAQIKTGCQSGSWDTKDPWCDDGGRVYSTAIMALCFETYYRYPKVFGVK